MALAETARLFAELTLKDNLTPNANRALGSVGRMEKGFGRIGTGAGKLQAGLFKAGTRIIAGTALIGAGAAKLAIDYEDAFAGIRKTVDETDLTKAGLSFEKLHDQILDLSTTIPVAATDLARIGEAAGALGIRAQDITEFTEVVAKLGVTTNLTTDQAADSLGRLGTILNLRGQDFANFADTLVNLGNKGASTESEIVQIAERFGSAGRAAGLATDEILGLSSAAASLRAGGGVEASGSALSRIFQNLAKEVALGSGRAKSFAKLLGSDLDTIKKKVNDGKGLPLFLDLLQKIRGLSRTRQAKVLESLGINNVRDLDTLRKLSQNYKFLVDQLKIAGESEGALNTEAQKRFDTLKSQFGLLKNNLVRLGIEAGEGMLPGLKKATEALTGLLKDPQFIQQARDFGKKIGDAIGGINWREIADTAKAFADALKPAVEWAERIFNAFNSLPTDVKGALLALAAANKLSGGLIASGIGDIAGGLGESLAKSLVAKVPLFGSAFVQPVFVTNMGAGGLGGVPGGAGGAGAFGPLATLSIFGLAGAGSQLGNSALTAGKDFLAGLLPDSRGIRSAFSDTLGIWIDNILPTPASLQKKFAEVFNHFTAPDKGHVPSFREQHRAGTTGPLTGGPSSFAAAAARDSKFAQSIADSKLAIVEQVRKAGDTFDRATSASKSAVVSSVTSGTSGTTGAVNTAASRIVGAFHSLPAPIVNVDVRVSASEYTTVVNSRTRSGSDSTSRNGGGGGSNQGGRRGIS